QYEVQIVQQPSRARSCGFSDKDRRPISPAPILQLIVRGLDGAIAILTCPRDVDTSFLLMQCDCRDAITKKPASIVLYPASEKQQRKETPRGMSNLVGACIASPAKLYNEQGELGIYFIFPELSVRSEGRFCLAFLLLNIGTSNTPRVVNTETISHVLTTTFSDVFTSYTAKRFPGVIPPTALSKCFGSQGIKIPTRRDTRTKQITTKDSIAENHANDSDNDEYK
ncbi:velvet factor, partial [Dichotomocladium elegans]